MNKIEAEKIMEMMESADGGCQVCVRGLFQKFAREFKAYRKMFSDRYRKLHQEKLFMKDDEN